MIIIAALQFKDFHPPLGKTACLISSIVASPAVPAPKLGEYAIKICYGG
jgi:hypothetical protein